MVKGRRVAVKYSGVAGGASRQVRVSGLADSRTWRNPAGIAAAVPRFSPHSRFEAHRSIEMRRNRCGEWADIEDRENVAMKTNLARWTWPAVVTAAMVWTATCRGQGLEIDIPVPEPGKTAADGKEPAKRKAPQRRETPPAREKAIGGGESAPLPSWANPAAIPLRQRDSTLAGPSPKPLESQAAASKATTRRAPVSRTASDAPSSPGRSGGLGRGALAAKKQQQPNPTESAPLLARRHRAATRDHAKDPLAPPSPWSSER